MCAADVAIAVTLVYTACMPLFLCSHHIPCARLLAVELIFSKLCECSALNPDSDVEEEGGASLFFDEAEVCCNVTPSRSHNADMQQSENMCLSYIGQPSKACLAFLQANAQEGVHRSSNLLCQPMRLWPCKQLVYLLQSSIVATCWFS